MTAFLDAFRRATWRELANDTLGLACLCLMLWGGLTVAPILQEMM